MPSTQAVPALFLLDQFEGRAWLTRSFQTLKVEVGSGDPQMPLASSYPESKFERESSSLEKCVGPKSVLWRSHFCSFAVCLGWVAFWEK